MKKIIFTILILINSTVVFAQKEIPYTIEDRERLIRLETRLTEGFNSLQRQIDDLKNKTLR